MSLKNISNCCFLLMVSAVPVIPFVCSFSVFPNESNKSNNKDFFIYVMLASVVYSMLPFLHVLHYLFKQTIRHCRRSDDFPKLEEHGNFPLILDFLFSNDNSQPNRLCRFIDILPAVAGPLLIWQWRQMYNSLSESDQNDTQLVYYADIMLLLLYFSYSIYCLFKICMSCPQRASDTPGDHPYHLQAGIQ